MINKATTIIKKYFFLLALVAMVGGFSAFKTSSQADELYWFELDEMGNVQQPISSPDGCLGEDEFCAIGFEELDNGNAPITHVSQRDPNTTELRLKVATP